MRGEQNMLKLPEIRTERLLLRTYVPEDMETVFLMATDPGIAQHLPGSEKITRESVIAGLPKRRERWAKQGFGQLGIVLRETGKLIGYCGLKYLGETGEVEIYYGIFPQYQRKGYAVESATAVLRFGFERAGLERIVGVTQEDNVDSQRVLEKIGLKRGEKADFYDMEVEYFSLDRSDYQPSRAEYNLTFTETDDQ